MLPRCLADLLWLLHSPSLLRAGDWPLVADEPLRQVAVPLLADWTPERQGLLAADLEAWIAARPRTYKLGIRSEALLDWGLRRTDRFRVIDAQVQLRQGGQSLGELDFLLEDRVTGQLEHWELAVKFFLWGVDGEAAWIGPDRKDRLALKLERMLHRQLPLSGNEVFRDWLRTHHPDLGDRPWQRRLLSRGWLFLPPDAPFPEQPLGSEQCGRGWWLPLREQARVPAPLQTVAWAVLPRSLWLSPFQRARDAGPEVAIAPDLEQAIALTTLTPPYLVAALDATGRELSRGFLIRDPA